MNKILKKTMVKNILKKIEENTVLSSETEDLSNERKLFICNVRFAILQFNSKDYEKYEKNLNTIEIKNDEENFVSSKLIEFLQSIDKFENLEICQQKYMNLMSDEQEKHI